MKFYKGDIEPGDDIIFVFGSNPVGINGNPKKGTGGAALVARLKFDVGHREKMDNCLSLSGKAYGLVTVTYPGFNRSLTKSHIISNIKILYQTAADMPDKKFMIAYKNTDKRSLNGYTGYEMANMFLQAGNIPDNIYFSENWKDIMITRRFNDYLESEQKNLEPEFAKFIEENFYELV